MPETNLVATALTVYGIETVLVDVPKIVFKIEL